MQKIFLKTKAGNLNWEKTANDEEFQTILSHWVIRVQRQFHDGVEDYWIAILDKDGTTLESISDSELRHKFVDVESDLANDVFPLMEELFRTAKRRALGVDGALDSILEELK